MPQPSPHLLRSIEAIEVPSGTPVMIPEGTEIVVTQSLGDSHTIHTPGPGGLYRVQPDDADALGFPKFVRADRSQLPFSDDLVWEELRNVYDPEIPVNIVDLGLVYGVSSKHANDIAGKEVHVAMTLTAPGCGMGPVLAAEARQRIAHLPGVARANVELVWDPPWNPERISGDGKRKLGID
jgi:probable FeS assembly SUF system protein SufT